MDKQYTGSEVPLSKDPLEMDPTQRGYPMLEQLTGTQAGLNPKPTGLTQYDNGIREGTFQLTGEQVSLQKTPNHGWDSANTPMSKRAIRQSQK